MLDYIKLIPDVVWAAAIASLLTLEGVLLTSRNNNKRLLKQLEHEKHQRDREREMAIRKDVYFKAAEYVSRAMTGIMRVANLDINDEELGKDISDGSAAFSKIHVVGTFDTVQSVSRFSGEMGTLYLGLLCKRYPLVSRKNQIDILYGYIQKSSLERDKIIELMKELNLQGTTEKRIWDLLKSNFEFEGKRVEEWEAQRNSLQKELQAKQIELLRECVSAHIQLGKLLVPAMVAIRMELELPIDEVTYTQMLEKETANQQKVMEDFLQSIKNMSNA